jgi:hypothetical protein
MHGDYTAAQFMSGAMGLRWVSAGLPVMVMTPSSITSWVLYYMSDKNWHLEDYGLDCLHRLLQSWYTCCFVVAAVRMRGFDHGGGVHSQMRELYA